MQDRPTVHELLGAVQRFLDEEIVPATEGRRQFLARVSAHTLRLIDRELEQADDHAATEWAGLDQLLGAELRLQALAALRVAIAARNQTLCARIQAGEADEAGGFRDLLLAHLRRVTRGKLRVTNLAYLRADGVE